MIVDIWSDTRCPFCFIGKKNNVEIIPKGIPPIAIKGILLPHLESKLSLKCPIKGSILISTNLDIARANDI